MKYLLTAITLCFCLSAMATTEFTNEKSSVSIETSVIYDRGRKKARRSKRIGAKRKRHCHKAARRNFAG